MRIGLTSGAQRYPDTNARVLWVRLRVGGAIAVIGLCPVFLRDVLAGRRSFVRLRLRPLSYALLYAQCGPVFVDVMFARH